MTVAADETQNYGILDVTQNKGRLVHARGMVEKPAPDVAPSRHAVVGRYVLDASIFEYLETQQPGAGGEIQLTDAIAQSAGHVGLSGLNFSGKRFDCGSKAGMLRATLHLALDHPECAHVMEELMHELHPIRAA
jgi:UTP-glucose-1-phosphate uridylyltransferase